MRCYTAVCGRRTSDIILGRTRRSSTLDTHMSNDSGFQAFREVTGLVRPPAGHGCPCVEVVPNLWTAHFHDVDTKDKLTKEAPPVTVVVNAGTDKCDTKPGSYGEGIEVVCIDGLLDDPDQLKKVDGMPEGADKAAARATLPAFEPEMCAGDAYKDFDRVSELITKTGAAGGATLVHCHASLSRSVAFILAHLMKTQSLSAVEAAKLMKSKWDATWPNDTFVKQLLKYEEDLAAAR